MASPLETTVDKILGQTRSEIISGLKRSLEESRVAMDGSLPLLEQEYERLVNDGRKEADKIKRRIVGASDLEARSGQLMLLEESVERVFRQAVEKICKARRDIRYSGMLSGMLDDAVKLLGTSEITVFANARDRRLVKKMLSEAPGASLSPDAVVCMGGIVAKSVDGSVTFNNTIDARLERIKPLIRKEVAAKFGIGS